MKVVKQTESCIILDDFCPDSEFELVVEYAQRNDYARNPKWIKPWDLSDAMPWQTGETVYHPTKKLHPDDPRRQYPTGTAIDFLFERMLNTKFYRQHIAPVSTAITARSYLHPQGSSLDWHDDGGRFSGAYSYYTHPKWHASWGGELLLIEDPLGRSGLPDKRHMSEGRVETIKESWNVLHKDDLSKMLMDGAVNTRFVFPKPNRLVMMRRGYWHKVSAVKHNAAMARCAIAGFFLPDDDPVPFWR